MSTQTFPVTGLTCGHCVGAITSELKALPGVTDVQIDLVVKGTSTVSVTADKALTDAEVPCGPGRGRRIPGSSDGNTLTEFSNDSSPDNSD